MAGNPTHVSGPLYRAFKLEPHLWRLISISADPRDPKRCRRVTVEWAQQQIDRWGIDDPWVRVNVFGEFPEASIDSLVGMDIIQDAVRRSLREEDFIWNQKRLGVDAARYGDDKTVIAPRQGRMAFKPVEMRQVNGPEIAARVAMGMERWEAPDAQVFVDDTGGYGATVIDSLGTIGISTIPVGFATRASDARYFNKRTEIYWRFAQWIKSGGCLPNDQELIQEIAAHTYTFIGGRFRVEEKDRVKERIRRSPDKSDAYALTFALPEQSRSEIYGALGGRAGGGGQARTEWDPTEEHREREQQEEYPWSRSPGI
jgi:hypothetical protein